MSGRKWEIAADEAWTHQTPPLNRYWCFFGGVFGSAPVMARLESRLENVANEFGYLREAKWQRVNARDLAFYTAFVDEFFAVLNGTTLKYRQCFLDRQYVHIPETVGDGDPLSVQFKVYYQFLKHSFGLQFLDDASVDDPHRLFVRLDDHSSQRHKNRLVEFAEDLPRQWGRDDVTVSVRFVRSKRHRRIQAADVLMGAAGSHGNQFHKHRADGRRGMSPNQKARHILAKHIYRQFHDLNCRERNRRAFNWFESTGQEHGLRSRWEHSARFWKFVPKLHRIDEGWQNKNLDKFGRYQQTRSGSE